MKIETKFNIGDSVWIDALGSMNVTICFIKICISDTEPSYRVCDWERKHILEPYIKIEYFLREREK
jgi:hypothetical protein